jgi:tyrosine aminotransferase
VSALSKRWLAPGWRVGWLVVHDYNRILATAGVQLAINNLCQVSLGPPTPIQAAVPGIFEAEEGEWLEGTLEVLRKASASCLERCARVRGLSVPSEPQGAMYVLVRMQADAFGEDDETFTDVEFAKRLLAEESVLVLPGTCFHAPGYLRIVITVPEDELEEAWNRLEAFCERHSRERKLTDSPKELHVLSGEVKAALKIVDSDEKLFAE